ncbi:MAG: two-component system activity regulator YycH [Bacillota bacterium]|nr:two-component system activity regulator YycH [Bacillota bacterium]
MKEMLKTLILILLIVLSLYLTYQLWYGQMPAELIAEDVLEEGIADKPRVMEEIIKPSRILSVDNEKYYRYGEGQSEYSLLWAELIDFLKTEKSPLSGEEYNNEEGSISEGLLIYTFEPPLPLLEDWIWIPERINSEVVQIKVKFSPESLDLIYTGREDEEVEVHLNKDTGSHFREVYHSLNSNERGSYSPVDDEVLSAMYDFEITVAKPFYLPTEWANPESLAIQAEAINREQILQSFFVDYNLARMIEEKDGGLIYTDGEKGLRLTKSGFEYSYPGLESGQATSSYADALLYSSNLIGYHGGWSPGLKLEKLSLNENPFSSYYSVDWRLYYDGRPIYSSIPTRALFNDLGLIHFTRSLYIPVGVLDDEEEGVIPAAVWSEALNAALTAFENRRTDFVKNIVLEEICPGYAVVGQQQPLQGEPVWFVQINGEKFYLTAAELKLLDEEDMQ